MAIFDSIIAPAQTETSGAVYSVGTIENCPNYLVGKDKDGLACFLLATDSSGPIGHSPIRLESIDVQFDLRCRVRRIDGAESEHTLTVIRCRESDLELTRYFLSICELMVRILGDDPSRSEIALAVERLATMLQRIRRPPSGPVIGLFGELFFLSRSAHPISAVRAWRSELSSTFDFAVANVRIEVKTTTNRIRKHSFSYEQCNPSSGLIVVVVSLQVEESAGGQSLEEIVIGLESRIMSEPELVLKLHQTITETLGSSLRNGLERRFDVHMAESSLRVFDVADVPAIRSIVPLGVSDVKFLSDLSAVHPMSREMLVWRDEALADLLPIDLMD